MLNKNFSPEIKNIIFDLGGVILNIDYNITINAFKQLGIINFDELYTQAGQCELFDKLDKGEITNNDFRNEVRQLLPSVNLSNKQIDDAWNAMLLDMPVERLIILEKLKPLYRTFLLSNTNAIHVPLFSEIVKSTINKNNLTDFFEATYYSNEIGMRKPNADIYEFVVQKHNLKPCETLFIDDSIQNVEGAQKVGLHAYHLANGETINQLFAEI